MLKGIVVQMHLFVPLKSFIVQIKQKINRAAVGDREKSEANG